MAEDRATMDAVQSIGVIFPGVDKETILDIYLGCKKDLDQTIEQLIGMGAEVEEKKPVPNSPVAPPKVEPVHTPVPNVQPLQEATNFTESPAEKARLELLNQQLSMEYRRLADTQESNIQMSRQLEAQKDSIAYEQTKLAEEKKKLADQQADFLADKKRLEEHLAVRLREMKEQMRFNEEQGKIQEEEARARLEEVRLAEDRERHHQEAERLERKEKRRADKARLREAEQAEKEQLLARIALLEAANSECTATLENCQHESARLLEEMSDLQSRLDNVHLEQQQKVGDAMGNLKSIVGWLHNGLQKLPDDITPADIREELHKALGRDL